MRRKRNGQDGVYIFVPFVTKTINKNESHQHPLLNDNSQGVMVNVGWMSLEDFEKNGLKDFKFPEMSKVIALNNMESNIINYRWKC